MHGATENGLSERYIDCKNLFNYAFDNFKLYTMHEENSLIKDLKVSKAGIFNNTLKVLVKDKMTMLLKKDTLTNNITPTLNITSELVAPITKNSVIGTITYEVDGNTYTSDLLAGNDIKESNFMVTLLIIVCIIMALVVIVRLITSNKRKKVKRKRKYDDYNI